MLVGVGVHPMHNPPILPKPQLIQIPNRISKRNNIIPIPTVQMNPNRSLLNESFILVHTSQLIHVILVKYSLVTSYERWILWDRMIGNPVELEILLYCFVVLAFFVLVVVGHSIFVLLVIWGMFIVLGAVASSVNVVVVYSWEKVIVSPEEKCTAGRSRVSLAGNLPIFIQCRVYEIMGVYVVYLAFL